MSPELDDLLAVAYSICELDHNGPAAVAHLYKALAANSELSREGAEERERLGAVIKARSVGGRHGDHVSVVLHGLLDKALGESLT